MSSPPNRPKVPPPRQGSNGSIGGSSTPRSSIDNSHQRYQLSHQQSFTAQQYSRPESSASGSRRQSNGEGLRHSSPTSISSHSHRGSISQHGEGSNWSNGKGMTNNGVEYRGLPRIHTSHADQSEDDGRGGLRSAPINGPLRPPSEHYNNPPIRSSSSPDPWLSSRSQSRGSTPNHSPTEHRPNFASNLGTSPRSQPFSQYNGGGRSQPPPGNILIPPRSSSQTENSRPITPESSAQSHDSYDPSLTPRNVTDPSAPIRRDSNSNRAGRRRHEPASCGQCGKAVHGQFVRAMGKVYHLECFRCKVRFTSFAISHLGYI